MATLSDHLRRDAEDAARSFIRVQLGRFKRRMEEAAKADIQQAIESAAAGETIDGFTLGTSVGERAFANYLGDGEPCPVIDASPATTPAPEAIENFGLRPGESTTILPW